MDIEVKESDLIDTLSNVNILHDKYIQLLLIFKDMLEREKRDISFIDNEIDFIGKQRETCDLNISFMLMVYNHMNSLYKANKNIL